VRLEDTGLLAQIGSVASYVAPEALGAAAFRYFAQAIGDATGHRHAMTDDSPGCEAAPVASPTLIFETNQYTGRDPDRHGFTGHAWDGIPSEAVWIRGGNEYRIGRPVRPEDRLHVTWTLVAARTVTTQDGRTMVQFTSEADYRSEAGDWLGWNRETMFLADPKVQDD